MPWPDRSVRIRLGVCIRIGVLAPAEWIDPVEMIVGAAIPKGSKLKDGIDHRRGVPPGCRARVAYVQARRSL